MKKKFTCLFLILLGLEIVNLNTVKATPIIYQSIDLTEDLISCWTLDESGGIRYDSVGENHLIETGDIGYVEGIRGNAARFITSSGNYLYIDDNPSLSMNGDVSFTIAGWLYFDRTGNQGVLQKWTSDTDNREYRVYQNFTNNRFRFHISSDGKTYGGFSESWTPANKWNYIVLWRDASDDTMGWTINGTSITPIPQAGIFDGNSKFILGYAEDGGVLDGKLDEFAIWKRVLTEEEKEYLYNSGNGRSCAEIDPPPPTPTPTVTPTPTQTLTPTPTATPTPRYKGTMAPPSITTTPAIETAVAEIIGTQPPNQSSESYAITNVTDYKGEGETFIVSVAGVISDTETWDLQENVDFLGTVVLKQEDETFTGGVQGSPSFQAILSGLDMDDSTKFALDSPKQSLATGETSGIIFPWLQGYSMRYGPAGVHFCEFRAFAGAMAVDMITDGLESLGHAPKSVYAADSGTVTYICKDFNNIAVKIGDFMYVHLKPSTPLYEGQRFNQGDYIGDLVSGSFESRGCGYAEQLSWNAHVHWCFQDTNHFYVEDWSLDVPNGTWYHQGKAYGVGTWIEATWIPGLVPGGGDTSMGTPGGNFWDPLVGGFASIASKPLDVLTPHTPMELARAIGTYAAVPIRIIHTLGLLNFSIAYVCILIILALEGVRLVVTAWFWLKNLFPTA